MRKRDSDSRQQPRNISVDWSGFVHGPETTRW
jgi:hypothetical protein